MSSNPCVDIDSGVETIKMTDYAYGCRPKCVVLGCSFGWTPALSAMHRVTEVAYVACSAK